MTKKDLDRYRGCLLGLAVGDAIGTTVEFKARGSFVPVTDMTGGGVFNLKPGQWTDDTSMALCLAESLVEKDGFGIQPGRRCRYHRRDLQAGGRGLLRAVRYPGSLGGEAVPEGQDH